MLVLGINWAVEMQFLFIDMQTLSLKHTVLLLSHYTAIPMCILPVNVQGETSARSLVDVPGLFQAMLAFK